MRHLTVFMATLVVLALAMPASAQLCDTPGAWTLVRLEPCVDELGPVGGKWAAYATRNGYTIDDRSFWRSTVTDYTEGIGSGSGIVIICTHSNIGVTSVQFFDTEDAAQSELDNTYAGTDVAQYLGVGATPNDQGNDHGWVITMTAAGVQRYFKSANTFVYNIGCYSASYSSSWQNARVVIGYHHSSLISNATADADSILFGMNGNRGVANRPLSSAINGVNIVSSTNLDVLGNANTVLVPSIQWFSPAAGTLVNHAMPFVAKTDCPIRPSTFLSTACGTSGGLAVSNISMPDAYTITGDVGPWTAGIGSVIIKAFNPNTFTLEGFQGTTGGMGLDGDAIDGPSDLVATYNVAVDNPAASLSSFTAVRQAGGAHVAWRPQSQSGTDYYLLFRSSSLLGPWNFVVSIPADSTQWDYAVDDPGNDNAFYELREVEFKGDTLVLDDTELRDPFALPVDPIISPAEADSLNQASWQGRAQTMVQPTAILPNYDITYVLPVDPTGAWNNAIQPLVADRMSKGFVVNVITMDQAGNTEQGLMKYNMNAYRYGLRGETLCASDEDSRYWNAFPWTNGWVQQTWPGNPQWALIPMHAWADPIGVQPQSISWFRPYLTSDWHYGDVHGDGRPVIAISRIPVTTPDELAVAVAKIIAYEQQDLTHGSYIVLDQGRSLNGESGPWASAVANTFATMIPSSLVKVRIHDTDAAPLTHAQALNMFLNICATQHVIGFTATGTMFNRSRADVIDLTQGDSWSLLGNGQGLFAAAAPSCEFFTGSDRRTDPTYGRGLGPRAFGSFPNKGLAWAFASNNGSHQGVNSDVGESFFRYTYQVGCWSGAEAARAAVYDAAGYSFEKDAANATIVEGDVCSPFPGQIIRTSGVERGTANHLRLSIDRNPSFGQLGATFSLPSMSQTDVSLFDLQGRRVETLVHGRLAAGMHRVMWYGTANGSSVSGGIFFLRLTSPGGTITQKITYLR